MKTVSSFSVMFCLTIIVIMFTDKTWELCEPSYKDDCSVYKKIYPIYKKLESIVTNNTETLFLMRQAFFPAISKHFVETERLNAVKIRVCWVPSETIPPPACNSLDSNSLDSNNQTAITETKCWNFRWSSSPGLNMIAVDQLLVFDPILTSCVYSRSVGKRDHKFSLVFDISPDIFPCTPSETELTQATVLLLTWSKAYAKAQGVPTTWSQEDQGYIARWYSYYCAEAYYEDESVYGHTIRKVLPINFTLLNLAVLYTIMTRGISWYHSTYEVLNKKHKQASKTYLAVGITTATLNFFYLTTTAVMYIRYSIPPIHLAECTAISDSDCSPSHTSSLYKDELASFVVKMLVFFIAISTELLVAIKAQIKTTLPTTKWCHSGKCYKVAQIILLWNTFVFVQIWLGLISLPACLLLFTTPLQTISVLCAVVLFIAAITASIVYSLQIAKKHRVRASSFGRQCGYFSWYFILVALAFTLASALGFLYFELLPQGVHLSTRGVIFSLIPSIALSATSWVVKRKFFHKDFIKVEKQLSISTVSTEEEDLEDPETEQDTRLDDLV